MPSTETKIFSVDIGGTWIKAAVIDKNGAMMTEWSRTATPVPAPPQAVLQILRDIARSLPDFQMISIAFPGVVKDGRTITAPNLGNDSWRDFDLSGAVSQAFSRPVRILNDAIIQGLGVAKGPGLECIVTFGTGLGFALFRDGRFLVQLELGRHIACDDFNYDAYVGHAAFVTEGAERWNERARYVLRAVRELVHFDRLYVGGGNARRIEFALAQDELVIPMTAGITGGARVWDEAQASLFSDGESEVQLCL